MAWKNYKPFNNGAYNTLWELARQLVDQYRAEYPTDPRTDEELIEGFGVPYLSRWIFTQNGTNTELDVTRPEWDEFMKQFFMKFLNMEICYMDARIWRGYISRTMLAYQDYIEETAEEFYKAIKGAGATTTSTRRTQSNGTETGKSTESGTESSTNSGTDSGESSTTRSGESSNKSTAESTATAKGTSANDGTTQSHNKTVDSTNQTGRVLSSDMPQSIVNASTVGNPDLTSWTYASGLQDTFNKSDGNGTSEGSTTNVTNTNTSDESSGTTTSTQSGTTSDTEKRSDSRKNNSTSSRETSGTHENNVTRADNGEETATSEVMSAFELNREKYEFFKEHMKKPIYTVLDACYKYFISVYPEESRMGFLDWGAIAGITARVKEE